MQADGSCSDADFILDLNIMNFILSLLTQLLAVLLPPSFHLVVLFKESLEMLFSSASVFFSSFVMPLCLKLFPCSRYLLTMFFSLLKVLA